MVYRRCSAKIQVFHDAPQDFIPNHRKDGQKVRIARREPVIAARNT